MVGENALNQPHAHSSGRLLTAAGTVTGLPALVAGRRGRSDLVLALAVGPALANLLLVCGAVALVQPLGVPDAVIMNEVPALALVTLLLLPALLNGPKVPRWEGALLLAAYAACVAWQISRAMRR
jgi:cation:H+ antiporter